MKARLVTRVAGLLATFALLACVGASAATPDGFGMSGYAFVPGAPSALGVQRSGRIVVGSGWSISALTSSGARDPAFASRNLSPDAECSDFCSIGMVIQPDDRVVVAGQHSVVRLTANGALDPSFGTGGRVSVPGIYIQSVGLARNGAIVVAGAQVQPDGSRGRIRGPSSVARLLPSGLSDPSFATRGTATLDARVGWPVAVEVDRDGGVVVAGLGDPPGTPLTRLRADGSTDSDFGEAGVTTIARLDRNAMVIQPDGRIVLGGLRSPAVAGTGLPQAVIARLDQRGHLDASFGEDGVAAIHARPLTDIVDVLTDLTIRPDGSFVAVGSSVPTCCYGRVSYALVGTLTQDGRQAHVELLGSGMLDPDAGCVSEGASVVTLQPDAKVLVGGWVCEWGTWVARLTQDLRPDAGPRLRLQRTQPSGTASLRAAGTNSRTRLTAAVRASTSARVVVSVRRARLVNGRLVATGNRVWLQPGSAAGRRTLKMRSRAIEAPTDESGQLSLRLLFSPELFSRGDRGIATLRAVDPRGQTAELTIEFVKR
jgi:uncharacterized delta-60 repeat protein